MSNYLYGNCVLSIEGDDTIYPIKPFNYEEKLNIDVGYLKDGYVYIYRGDISKKRKFKSGLFTNDNNEYMFFLDNDEKDLYAFDKIKDDSIASIIRRANNINPRLQHKIMKDINKSTDIYIPELDENDDFLKHLVKLMLIEKKISLKDYKDKFKKTHDITNIKASLDTKTSPDGKRGALTINNLLKWVDLLDMDILIEFKDNKNSLDPSNKIFRYDSTSGYDVIDLGGDEEDIEE